MYAICSSRIDYPHLSHFTSDDHNWFDQAFGPVRGLIGKMHCGMCHISTVFAGRYKAPITPPIDCCASNTAMASRSQAPREKLHCIFISNLLNAKVRPLGRRVSDVPSSPSSWVCYLPSRGSTSVIITPTRIFPMFGPRP